MTPEQASNSRTTTDALRVLLIEDSENDAMLILRELRRSGYDPVSERVETAGAMRSALSSHAWDVILCDYVIPGFGGLEALAIATSSGLDIPMILLSNKASEEILVEAMKAGATDFVMKDRLSRLGPVIKRELIDAKARRGLRQARLEWKTAFDAVEDAIFIHDTDFRVVRGNQAYASLSGMPADAVVGKFYWEVFPKLPAPMSTCSNADERDAMAEQEVTLGSGELFVSRSFPIRDPSGAYGFSVHILTNMTEHLREKRAKAALLELSMYARDIDEGALLQNGLDTIQSLTTSSIGFLHFVSEDQNSLELVTWTTDTKAKYCNAAFDRHYPVSAAGIWADSLRQRLPIIINDYDTAPHKNGLPHGHAALKRFISVPILDNNLVRMIVGMGNAGSDYTERDVETIKLFAYDLFRIVQLNRAQALAKLQLAQLETAFMSTVEVATTLSEMRDPYTTGHERRVADIAVAIGAAIGFDTGRLEGLRVAGLLHDVGKITVPAEILSKPSKLTSAEFMLVKDHARASYEVLKDVKFPWPVAEVALQHHERMDGSGYPRGLKGDEILLEARIMSVADVVEAMASHRPYRAGLGIDKALDEIERGRGTAYDAVIADACLTLFRKEGYAIPP